MNKLNLLSLWLVWLVTFHVGFEVTLLCKSFTTFRAGELILLLLVEVKHLVFLESVFPAEALATVAAPVGGLPGVGHLVLPKLVRSVVLHGAKAAVEPCNAQVLFIVVRPQVGVAGELGSTGVALRTARL